MVLLFFGRQKVGPTDVHILVGKILVRDKDEIFVRVAGINVIVERSKLDEDLNFPFGNGFGCVCGNMKLHLSNESLLFAPNLILWHYLNK